MEFFKNILLTETQKAAAKEVEYTIAIVNKIYNEWKKIKRRVNAVDIVTTSANKLSNIDPSFVDKIHEATKVKLCIIIMRCMDIPPWKPLETKERIYKKLYPLINRLQGESPKTGTGGNLRDVIMTRLSAAISHQRKDDGIFVAYEAKIPSNYFDFLFGRDKPARTFRMQSLSLPDDFETLLNVLIMNHEKAVKKHKVV